MERKIKDTPPRLPVVFQSYDPPLYLVTFNTLLRRPLLACDAVHAAFREYAERGFSFHVATGRYVLMPDHVHVFVRIGRDMTLRRWESGLKQRLGKTLRQLGHQPTRIPCSVEPVARLVRPQAERYTFCLAGCGLPTAKQRRILPTHTFRNNCVDYFWHGPSAFIRVYLRLRNYVRQLHPSHGIAMP